MVHRTLQAALDVAQVGQGHSLPFHLTFSPSSASFSFEVRLVMRCSVDLPPGFISQLSFATPACCVLLGRQGMACCFGSRLQRLNNLMVAYTSLRFPDCPAGRAARSAVGAQRAPAVPALKNGKALHLSHLCMICFTPVRHFQRSAGRSSRGGALKARRATAGGPL